jgi:murein DD-endopeptidase MepM/ murein hydrolase activator NlpD
LLTGLLVVALPGTAAADSGGAMAPTPTGGSVYQAPPVLATRSFSVAPRDVVPGATLTVRWRVDGRARRMHLRVDLRPTEGGRAIRLDLGRRRTNRRGRFRWAPDLAPGSYTALLRASAARRHSRRVARVSSSSTITVTAPAATPPPAASGISGVFPLQGAYSFGGPDARFGAVRAGHMHQGQDVIAAEGTPIVSPRAGFVYWRAYQAGGAGNYVVVRGDDGRDYVFMHFEDGSTAVQKGQPVTAGQLLGRVGATGDADGPHLHFEIWPDGWYAKGSQPIDPLPDLEAWAAAG